MNCIKATFSRSILALSLAMILLSGRLDAQERINPNLREVIIVFKTHFDNGYTDLSETVLQKYSTTLIKGALEGIVQTAGFGKDQQFGWTLSGYPMKEILRRNPELKPQVSEAIRKGQFAIHALPFTFETESMTPELLVRGFRFSDDIATNHDLDLPIDAKLTDVPSHSWILPTVLDQAGVKFLHLGCNPASRSPEVPLLFWWEGPDGSRLMTMYWGGYYGTDLVPPEGWPYKTWIAIIHTNDNQGAPPPEEIRATLEKALQLAPNARIRVGRMSDFYHSLMKEDPALPVVKGDMPDTWIHGYFSMPKEFRDYSRTLRDLKAVETVSAIHGILNGNSPLPEPDLANAYEQLLLFSEHTFGMAMSHGHSGIWRYDEDFRFFRALGDYELIEHSWKEKGDHVFQAQRITLPALEKQLNALASSVKVEGTRIVVFNPLSYSRTSMVEIRAHSGWYGLRGLKDADSGEPVLLENRNNVYRFLAKEVPGMGYRTYVPAEPAPPQSSELMADSIKGMLKNQFLTIKLDTRTGRLISIIENSSGRDMVGSLEIVDGETGASIINPGSELPFGGYIYQLFDKAQVESYAKAYIKGGWDWAPAELGRPNLDNRSGFFGFGTKPVIRWAQSPNLVSVSLHYSPTPAIPQDYTLVYTLKTGQPALEITWAIDSKPAQPWPEAGWIAFPFNLVNPEFRVGRLGGIADPKKDFIKGSNFDYYLAQNGVALFGPDGSGFAVASPDAPAVSLDRPGLWTWTGDFKPEKANVFFNLFNNQWSTNFTEWIEGSWSAKFYVWPFKKYEASSALINPAEEFTTPFYAAIAGGKGGNNPLTFKGIGLSHKNVTVTSFGAAEEGDGYLLRLWENAGKTVECQVILPEGHSFTSARAVDLRGRETGLILPVKGGKLTVTCTGNRPFSLMLH